MQSLTVVVIVQCRTCSRTYAKPEGGGTMKTNPGCPRCGSLGWVPAEEGATEAVALRRFDGGPPRALASRPG